MRGGKRDNREGKLGPRTEGEMNRQTKAKSKTEIWESVKKELGEQHVFTGAERWGLRDRCTERSKKGKTRE
jgi:hypothetical protein